MTNSSRQPSRNKGRLTLLLLAAVFLAPMAAAYVAYLYWPSGEPGNYGTLINPPRPLESFEMVDLEGNTAGINALRGKWTLLYVGGDPCAEQCRRNLYNIERVRLTQGDDMSRVQSLYLAPRSIEGRAVEETLVEYAGVRGYRISRDELADMVPGFDWGAGEVPGERVYLVDPLGNLMMFYPGDADPSGMKEDLERLLKVSQIG